MPTLSDTASSSFAQDRALLEQILQVVKENKQEIKDLKEKVTKISFDMETMWQKYEQNEKRKGRRRGMSPVVMRKRMIEEYSDEEDDNGSDSQDISTKRKVTSCFVQRTPPRLSSASTPRKDLVNDNNNNNEEDEEKNCSSEDKYVDEEENGKDAYEDNLLDMPPTFSKRKRKKNDSDENSLDITTPTFTKRGRGPKFDDERWHQWYRKLKKYKEENGNCVVPRTYKNDPSLGNWVSVQRKLYKCKKEGGKRTITEERIGLLDDIGFEWSLRPAHTHTSWDQRFKELEDYKKNHGDCLVPAIYEQNKGLGAWVQCQRKKYKRGNMTEEQKEKLEGLGFVWHVSSGGSRSKSRH